MTSSPLMVNLSQIMVSMSELVLAADEPIHSLLDFLPALKSGDSSYHVKHDRSGSCC